MRYETYRAGTGQASCYRPAPRVPDEQGGLCRKGWTSADLLTHPDRLLTPLVRNSKTPPLRPASWEEALGRIAAGIADVQTHCGTPNAVGSLAVAD